MNVPNWRCDIREVSLSGPENVRPLVGAAPSHDLRTGWGSANSTCALPVGAPNGGTHPESNARIPRVSHAGARGRVEPATSGRRPKTRGAQSYRSGQSNSASSLSGIMRHAFSRSGHVNTSRHSSVLALRK